MKLCFVVVLEIECVVDCIVFVGMEKFIDGIIVFVGEGLCFNVVVDVV